MTKPMITINIIIGGGYLLETVKVEVFTVLPMH